MSQLNRYHCYRIRRMTLYDRTILYWLVLLSIVVVNSETTTMIVPLPMEAKTKQKKTPLLSLSTMNGQPVVVLDEETASALKDATSPIPILLNPAEKKEETPNILFYDPNKNHEDIYDQEGNLVPIDLKQKGVIVIPPKPNTDTDTPTSDNTDAEPSTTTSLTTSATNTTIPSNVTNTVRTHVFKLLL